MNRNALALRARIATRAYYLAEASGFTASPVECWLAAEVTELALSAKRSASAVKAAATRKAKAGAAIVQELASAESPCNGRVIPIRKRA